MQIRYLCGMSQLPLLQNQDLSALCTFGVPAKAAHYLHATTPDHLLLGWGWAHQQGLPALVLGGGSNVLMLADWPGLVLHVGLSGIDMLAEDADTVHVLAGAGVVWNDLVQFAVSHGWGGIENLVLIPGTVGAAPIQNIGAYGVEIKDVLVAVQALDVTTGQAVRLLNAECGFGYRDSIFKRESRGRYIITGVELRLSKHPELHIGYGDVATELAATATPPYQVQDVARVVANIRRRKLPDPAEFGNAGSFFKNPVVEADVWARIRQQYPTARAFETGERRFKLAAGWLIEQAGWRGKRQGAVGAFERQALVIVNYGGATGREVWQYAQAVQASVWDMFGVRLEAEVQIIDPDFV